jgi:hypothetical protein
VEKNSLDLDIASHESSKKFLPNISNLYHFNMLHLMGKYWEVSGIMTFVGWDSNLFTDTSPDLRTKSNN